MAARLHFPHHRYNRKTQRNSRQSLNFPSQILLALWRRELALRWNPGGVHLGVSEGIQMGIPNERMAARILFRRVLGEFSR